MRAACAHASMCVRVCISLCSHAHAQQLAAQCHQKHTHTWLQARKATQERDSSLRHFEDRGQGKTCLPLLNFYYLNFCTATTQNTHRDRHTLSPTRVCQASH